MNETNIGKVTIQTAITPFCRELKELIWKTPDVQTTLNLKKIVIELYDIGCLTFGEYVFLNNEIDKYTEYSLSHGVRTTRF